MSPIDVLVLSSVACLSYALYRIAAEVAFRRRDVIAAGRVTDLARRDDPLDEQFAGLPVSRPVEVVTVAVLVSSRSSVERRFPQAPVEPGRYSIGDLVRVRLDPLGDRDPALAGAEPTSLARWIVAALFFAECTTALVLLATVGR